MLTNSSTLKLAQGVNSEARALLDKVKRRADWAIKKDNSSADQNKAPGIVSFDNHQTDSFTSDTLSMKFDPTTKEVDWMHLTELDTYYNESIDLDIKTDGDVKTYSQSERGWDGPVKYSVTVNESTGTITDYSNNESYDDEYIWLLEPRR